MLTKFPISTLVNVFIAGCNGKNPRYAIFLTLHLNIVTVVIESLKFTNRAQRQREAGSRLK